MSIMPIFRQLTRQTRFSVLILMVFSFSQVTAVAEEPENVRIKLLTPDVAAAGLRVFKSDHQGEMDRNKMAVLMNRALDNLETPDGVIEKATGSAVTIKLSEGSTLSIQYEEAAHAWDGQIWVVVLPQ